MPVFVGSIRDCGGIKWPHAGTADESGMKVFCLNGVNPGWYWDFVIPDQNGVATAKCATRRVIACDGLARIARKFKSRYGGHRDALGFVLRSQWIIDAPRYHVQTLNVRDAIGEKNESADSSVIGRIASVRIQLR